MPRLDSSNRDSVLAGAASFQLPLLSPKMKEVGGNGGVTHRLPVRNYSNTRLNVPATEGASEERTFRAYSSYIRCYIIGTYYIYIYNATITLLV